MRRKWLSGCLAVCVMAMSMVGLPLAAEASPQEAASTTDVDKNGDVHKHTARFNVNAVSLGNAVYYLADDIVMSWQKTIPVNGHATLCLNGHKLDVNGKYLTFTIAKNASLTICDCSTVETKGHINDAGLWEEGESQGNANSANLTGGIITGINGDASFVKCEGTVRFESGNIAGNSINERHGFLVSNHGGTVILDGGTIAGNKGAAMMVADDKSYGHVESGKINNNVADKFVLKNEGALTVRGGELSENKSNLGLIGNTSTGTLLLGGSPIIKDNIGDGNHHTIFLAEKPLVILDGFHPERVIGVGMEHPEVFTKDWNTHMPGSHPAEYFYSEQPGYSISQNDSGEGLFVAGDTYPIIYKDLGGGTFSGELPEGAVKIHQLGTATVLPEPTKNGYVFKGWYTDYTGNGAPLTEIAETYNQTPVVYAKWVKAVQAPTITKDCSDVHMTQGDEALLLVDVQAEKDATVNYQWYQTNSVNDHQNGTAVAGATTNRLTIGRDKPAGTYYYYCVVTASRDGLSASTTSKVATVVVNKPALQAPSITEQPKNLTLDYGAEESLSVQATSPTEDALSYQWYQTADKNSTINGTAIDGATQSTLTVGKDAKPGSYYYYCVVTASRDGLSASTTSKVATVVVNKPALQAPSITEQPKNLTLDYGAEESLSVQATSPTDDALSYQWYQTADKNSTTNATTINGATQSTLTVGKDAKPGSYYYYCVVTASRDTQQLTTTSSIATVTVNKPSTPPSKPNPQPPVQNPGETVTHPDGSVTTTVTKPNGTTVATTVSPNGDKLILTTYPEGSVEVAVSGTTPRVVTVPVKDVSAGTVPLVTDCNGKQTVVQRSVVTAEGVVLSVNDGDVIEFLHKVPSFADVPDAHWAKDAVVFAWARGLLVGVDDTHFAPEALTTRAMIWSILSRMEGVPSVGGEHWYQPGQEWAMENGVSDGTMPEASITREQLAAMLYRYAGSPDAKGNLSGYRDASMVNDWAKDAMIWAVDEGIVAGMTDDTLVPQGTATRAQTAAMLERFISWQLGVQIK